ncbi:hypothetical protein DSO57_1033875 [Entomophthora muscae]|uniref:Uncharacterized protein n=1 Tax=Entomophthora muscae TaxID=34485 RepID=A0ACC2UKN2_9FUNG|nr:hypothetical protein DSO57_1033875 [Entomophthora muscae]
MDPVEQATAQVAEVIITAAYNEAPADYIIKGVQFFVDTIAPVTDRVEALANAYFPRQFSIINEYLASHKSPLSDKFPLMKLSQVLFLMVFYLSTVFIGKAVTKLLPRLEVKLFSLLHNFCMVALSGYMCASVVSQALADKYFIFANPADQTMTGYPMAKIIWVFYVSKVPEFIDTFIMVVKKNYRQISFLHVYHHCSIFGIWWFVTLMAPNGDAYFSAALNSFIHVVMYGYYFLSAIGIKQVSFIKRYITVGQMTQFSLNFIQATYNIIDCYYLRPKANANGELYPLVLSLILWFYMISMLGLFYNFFVQDRRRVLAQRKALGKKIN